MRRSRVHVAVLSIAAIAVAGGASTPASGYPLTNNWVPLYASVVQGSYRVSSLPVPTIVECTLEVGTDTPYGYEGDHLTILYAGYVECSNDDITKSGVVKLLGYNVASNPRN
jgi:hypothetical protein